MKYYIDIVSNTSLKNHARDTKSKESDNGFTFNSMQE